MPYLIYVLEVQASGLAVDVRLNGASAFSEARGAERFLQTKLNPFLVAGGNEIEVLLGPPPPPPPDEKAPPPPPKAFKLRAFRAEWGKEGPDEGLAEYAYAGDPPLPEEGKVSVIKLPFDAGAAHGRWAWQDAKPFAPGDRGAVIAIVQAAHAALVARDAGGYAALTKLRNEELGRALDTPADELVADERAYLQGFFAAPDWAVGPLDPAALVLTPSAGGKLVQVTDAAGGPPLRGAGGGRPLAIGVTVSQVEGGYRIVR